MLGWTDGATVGSNPTAAHNALHAHTEGFMFYGIRKGYGPNFEVLCFDEFNTCVNKEYFERLDEAREFAEAEQTKLDYEWVSVTPMNDAAYDELCQPAQVFE